eukprot:385297-Pelagomonas_calceolata.AAC.5
MSSRARLQWSSLAEEIIYQWCCKQAFPVLKGDQNSCLLSSWVLRLHGRAFLVQVSSSPLCRSVEGVVHLRFHEQNTSEV